MSEGEFNMQDSSRLWLTFGDNMAAPDRTEHHPASTDITHVDQPSDQFVPQYGLCIRTYLTWFNCATARCTAPHPPWLLLCWLVDTHKARLNQHARRDGMLGSSRRAKRPMRRRGSTEDSVDLVQRHSRTPRRVHRTAEMRWGIFRMR